MVAKYENGADANQQIGGCVVMYDDKPVLVSECFDRDADILANISFLPHRRDLLTISLFDPKFDAKSMGRRLGYVNTFGEFGAYFLTRIPSRQYKQGLHANNVNVPDPIRRQWNFNHIRIRPEFTDTLMGVYPTFEEARTRLMANPDIKSIAFSRYFAIERDELGFFLVFYRGDRVAWGEPNSFKIPSHYDYLKEVMQENGVVVA